MTHPKPRTRAAAHAHYPTASVGKAKTTDPALMAWAKDVLVKATKAAKSTALMAVYDANGNLVGTVDPDDIVAMATPPGTSSAPASAAAPVDPTDVADDIQKAVACAQFVPGTTTTEIRKAAGTVDDRFETLLKSMGRSDAHNVKGAVGKAAAQMIVVGKVTPGRAITLAKSAALEAAESQIRIRKAATPEAVQTVIARRFGGR